MFDELINELEQKSKEAIKTNEGDYIENNLLHCGKCHTPKQCEVIICGKLRHPYCLCKCESERVKAEEREKKQREREARIAKRIEIAFDDSTMREMTFEKDDKLNPELSNAFEKYVENFAAMRDRGQGLLLFGKVGCGKTYYAAAIANALLNKGYSVRFTNFARIANELGATFDKQDIFDELNGYSLLVLDDLAAERKTEYMAEVVYNVIDARYRAGLPVIITTNLTRNELLRPETITERRIYDRILEKCAAVEVKNENRRQKDLGKSQKEMREILGIE